MDRKLEQRAAIKFCYLLRHSATESYWELIQAYDNDSMSRTQAFEWYKKFLDGVESIKDEERSGRPKTSVIPGPPDRNVLTLKDSILKNN